jgi:hypothetical protein
MTGFGNRENTRSRVAPCPNPGSPFRVASAKRIGSPLLPTQGRPLSHQEGRRAFVLAQWLSYIIVTFMAFGGLENVLNLATRLTLKSNQ